MRPVILMRRGEAADYNKLALNVKRKLCYLSRNPNQIKQGCAQHPRYATEIVLSAAKIA